MGAMMRRRIGATAAGLALAVILLVNFRTPEDVALLAVNPGSAGPDPTSGAGAALGTGSASGGTTGTSPGGVGSTGSTTSNGSSGVVGSSRSAPTPTPNTATTEYTGPLAADPYGNVQVQITVSGGKLIDVAALALPVGGHSGRISNFVAPILRTQALAAQSASIDGVSGATYTSRAYAASLQGALDQAGL